MSHPGEIELALHVSGDLNLPLRWRVAAHVAGCPRCRGEAAAIRRASEAFAAQAARVPRELHWDKLSAEMRANIHLGLEAGRIAGPVEESRRPASWRVAAAVASMAAVAMGGWWLNRPVPGGAAPPAASAGEIVLSATGAGIEMREDGRALALMHRSSENVTLTVGAQGSLRARYVDEETFEVTIHHVFAR